jgi:hypothetical protein
MLTPQGPGSRLLGAAPFAGTARGPLETWSDRFGSAQFSHDCLGAIAMPVLIEGLSPGLEVADEDVLCADRDVVVAPGTLVELARDAEHQHHHVVVEVDAAQALSTCRKVGVVHGAQA